MKIALGSDHGGFEVKEAVSKTLSERGIEVEDAGCYDKKSADYPDFAREVATMVSRGLADQGILVCKSGIGMSIAANKFPRVRAALCLSPQMAEMARTHNNANILTLGGDLVSKGEAGAIVDEWLKHSFQSVERYERRINKIDAYAVQMSEAASVYEEDPETYTVIQDEARRQRDTIILIGSENYVSRAVREAEGSICANKYAEGYPGKRWYRGCDHIDAVERLAVERAKRLFSADHVNVQPHCGSAANMAVYFAVLQPGDTILAMSLLHGGHLTHGHNMNFSGRLFNIVGYGVREDTEQIDYDGVAALAREHKPGMIVAGASAYSRILDFKRFREIADSVDAYLMVDIAHIAGLVAGGCHPNPIPYADFVSGTTHKTLRGPRGGLILCREKYGSRIDRQVFPGIQGGPEMHTITAKAVCFHEALKPAFKQYAEQIVRNARVLARALGNEGFRIVSGGTDNHLFLVDLSPLNITGRNAAATLENAGLIVNKNVIPFDKKNPLVTSGIRIGTPAATTRGMKESEMEIIAGMITDVLHNVGDETVQKKTREKILELTSLFPVP